MISRTLLDSSSDCLECRAWNPGVMKLLGIDLGSSSVKASLLDVGTGRFVGSATSPETEMVIALPEPGFAEQDPAMWYRRAAKAVRGVMGNPVWLRTTSRRSASPTRCTAWSVSTDQKSCAPPSSGATAGPCPTARRAFEASARKSCLEHLMNSPGNFTAAKLAWVKENEPEIFRKIDKIMLPGDWLAMR